jgi:hypothetical protein
MWLLVPPEVWGQPRLVRREPFKPGEIRIGVCRSGAEVGPVETEVSLYTKQEAKADCLIPGELIERWRAVVLPRTATEEEKDKKRHAVVVEPHYKLLLVEAREVVAGGKVLASLVLEYDSLLQAWTPGRMPSQRGVADVEIVERRPLKIYALRPQPDLLVGRAEVFVFASSGQCIRRGWTGIWGEGFNAEENEAIDPAHRRLHVLVRKELGGKAVVGEMLLEFDRNNWRPLVAYNSPSSEPFDRHQPLDPSVQWQRRAEYHAKTGQFCFPLESFRPPQVRVRLGSRLAEIMPDSTGP